RHGIVTQRVCARGGAIVTASDIDKGAIADYKRSASRIRQRGLYRPGGRQLFVVIDRRTHDGVSPGRNDTSVTHRCTVEPQPNHIHRRPNAPSVGLWVVDLRFGDAYSEWSRAPEQVKFPLVHRTAWSCYRRWDGRVSAPGVSRNIIDLQVGHFASA